MALQCGIVGLPNVGKSTLFNALTESSIPAENYPFCTIEPHMGIVELPDGRLNELGKIYNPEKILPATVEFTDIAGLVRGASKGEGLGNQFLGQIRQTAAIIHVVRCFDDDNVTHVEGSVNPIRDAETIETELLLADLDTLEKRHRKTDKTARSGDKLAIKELNLINRLLAHCNEGHRARTLPIHDEEEKNILKSLFLLSSKPILYIANVDEAEIMQDERNKHVQALFDFAAKEGNSAIRICASIEQEIAVLPEEEKELFLAEYNLPEPGLHKVIHASFSLLGLQTYFTCGEKEVRAWTVPVGATAPKAAGEIHSDFERGFIKAEIFHYKDVLEYGSEKALTELGLIRQEGKQYIVKDGDCIFFKFNV
jgi:GTP-binding protein YchF